MSGKYVLDTNIVIALFAAEPCVLALLRTADEVFISSIVIGELYFGARKSTRAKDNIARVDQFVKDNAILSCDAITASIYGEVKDRLKQKGKPIPENDIWIAAIAQQHELTLVTRDAHFNEVEHLAVESC